MLDFNNSNQLVSKVDIKTPIKFMFYILVFIYVFQYPLSLLINEEPETRINITTTSLVEAYFFVLFSSIILFTFFYLGTRNNIKKVSFFWDSRRFIIKKINFNKILLLFSFFFLWSFVMLKFKIGMTMYVDFEPLPFKITGLFFYGRLFLQPIILAYIAHLYSDSPKKNIIFFLLFFLGLWVAITSGSRFASIMFAVPVLLLFKGRSRFILFGVSIFIFIMVGTLSRHFYLPYQIGGDYIEIYANELYQSNITKDLIFLPFNYAIFRIMGISEVILTLNFQKSTDLFQGFLSLFSYFIPIIKNPNLVSAKSIYGFSDDEFGGFGLDMFSNYWLYFGRNIISYTVGLSIISFLLGKIYIFISIVLQKLRFNEGDLVVFILLFILFIEARAFMFPILLFLSWFFYKIKIKA
jgi:hypothetical protein